MLSALHPDDRGRLPRRTHLAEAPRVEATCTDSAINSETRACSTTPHGSRWTPTRQPATNVMAEHRSRRSLLTIIGPAVPAPSISRCFTASPSPLRDLCLSHLHARSCNSGGSGQNVPARWEHRHGATRRTGAPSDKGQKSLHRLHVDAGYRVRPGVSRRGWCRGLQSARAGRRQPRRGRPLHACDQGPHDGDQDCLSRRSPRPLGA
jgi:hypothetical protein